MPSNLSYYTKIGAVAVAMLISAPVSACGGAFQFQQDGFRVVYKVAEPKRGEDIVQVSPRACIRIIIADDDALKKTYKNPVERLSMLAEFCETNVDYQDDMNSFERAEGLLNRAVDFEKRQHGNSELLKQLTAKRTALMERAQRDTYLKALSQSLSSR